MECVQVVILEGLILLGIILDVVLLHVRPALAPGYRGSLPVEQRALLEVMVELRLGAEFLSAHFGFASKPHIIILVTGVRGSAPLLGRPLLLLSTASVVVGVII